MSNKPNRRPAQRTATPRASTRASGRASARGANTRVWWVVGVVAVVAIAAAVAVAAGGGGNTAEAGEIGPRVTVEGASLPSFATSGFGDSSDPAIGHTPPTLSGKTFDGADITFGDTGKPRMVLFLAHWCPHCQAEVPLLVQLADEGAFDGVDVQSIATGTSPEQPNYPPSAWLEREGWTFPVLADDAKYRAAAAYGLESYPYFVFVDADGKVVLRGTGELDPADVRKVLDALVAGEDPTSLV